MMPRRLLCLLPAAGCLLSVAGCSVLAPLQHRPLPASVEDVSALDDGYRDYAGVIHVHTTYSHDAHGAFEDVVRVANAQALDYVITTEHNNLRAMRDGKEGWHGAVLVLIGMEISTRDGHYVAMNVTDEIDRAQLTTQQIIDEVNRQGGLGFIAHPYFKHARWRNWAVTGFTGIEAYNVAHDTLDENKLRLALWTIFVPPEPFYFSIIDRPYDPLRKWDELIAERGRIVGIGSTDAHEFHAAGLKFAPYEVMFQMVRTHLLSTQAPLSKAVVYDALRRGHAYLELSMVGDGKKGFECFAEDGRQVLGIMGDEIPLQPDFHLTIRVPTTAELTLFKDGRVIGSRIDHAWRLPVTEPGAYRVEASLYGKPWLFSNPIYVRAAAPSTAPTLSLPPSPSPEPSSEPDTYDAPSAVYRP